MATLATVIDYLQTQIATISGLNSAPSEPPDETTDYPFFVVRPSAGRANLDENNPINWHNVAIEVHVSRLDFPKGYIDDFGIENVFTELRDDLTLGGGSIVDVTAGGVEYTFSQALTYAGVETIGYLVIVAVKQVQ